MEFTFEEVNFCTRLKYLYNVLVPFPKLYYRNDQFASQRQFVATQISGDLY